MRSIEEIILHCSDSDYGDAALIDRWHRARGFERIGYHFVILNAYPDEGAFRLKRPCFDRDGAVEIGREIEAVGAHVRGRNQRSVGICLIGRDIFSAAQFAALASLTAKLRDEFPSSRLLGHLEVVAPGDPLKSCPNLDMDYIRGLLDGRG